MSMFPGLSEGSPSGEKCVLYSVAAGVNNWVTSQKAYNGSRIRLNSTVKELKMQAKPLRSWLMRVTKIFEVNLVYTIEGYISCTVFL